MKQVLIPTDFSDASTRAITQAIKIFQKSGVPCHILLLNTYLVPKSPGLNIIEANDAIKKQSLSAMEMQKKKIQALIKNSSSIQVDTVSILGALKNVLARVIKENKIDLVIMGKDEGKHVAEISKVIKENDPKCVLEVF